MAPRSPGLQTTPLFLPYSTDFARRRLLHAISTLSQRSWSLAGNFASMAAEPATPTATPLPALQEEESEYAKWRRRQEERRRLREAQLQEALVELHEQHQEERRALSQELLELAVVRKDIRDQVWADWISSSLPGQQRKLSAELPTADRCLVEHGEEEAASNLKCQEQVDGGASSSTAGAALNGKEGLGKRDEEISCCVESSLKVSQQWDEEKQALLKELLPAKTELRVEVQRLLEVLDEKALRKAYEHRIRIEDPREIRARQRTLTAERGGLWRFVFKKEEARNKLVELEETAEDDINYVDQGIGLPGLPESYEEIRKLLDIEENPIFSKTLQQWNQHNESLTLQLERLKNQMASVKNEVYQLIGFVSVFQGVLLTAVSQSSLLYCHNKWSPITLSVLASVISILGVLQKWSQINDLQRNVDSVLRDRLTAVLVGHLLREPGPKGIDFVQLNAEIERTHNRRLKLPKNRHLAWLYFVLVALTLVAFVVLFPVSFWRILCKPGAPPPAR